MSTDFSTPRFPLPSYQSLGAQLALSDQLEGSTAPPSQLIHRSGSAPTHAVVFSLASNDDPSLGKTCPMTIFDHVLQMRLSQDVRIQDDEIFDIIGAFYLGSTECNRQTNSISPEESHSFRKIKARFQQIMTRLRLKSKPPDSIEEVIEYINLLGHPKCAERILFLSDTDDIEEGEQPLQLKSALGFLTFLSQFDVLGKPRIGLFSRGTLSMGWGKTEDKRLLVEPLDIQSASFALITPSPDNPTEKSFISRENMDIEDIIKTLQEHKVDQWTLD